jgi:integrase
MAVRDGIVKRGNTWSYVVRVKDSETGLSKPRWVGGFASEADAKAARDQARVTARSGQYVNRSPVTVGSYLDQWIEAHAVQVKPKTLQDYRHLLDRHVKPRIGGMRLQAVRPAQITKLYRDLLTEGGRSGAGLSPRTVEYVHAVLRKAFRDAVLVDQLLPSNPVERANGRVTQRVSAARSGRLASFASSSMWPAAIACSLSSIWLLTPVPAAASCSTCAGVM